MSTRLLDEMRDIMRRRHYSIHTERALTRYFTRRLLLYKHVLEQPLSGEINADRARRKVRIPVVLTRVRRRLA